jgi:hypothetical protein
MDHEHTQGYPPALVIGGMHRSGTSLTASILAGAGVHLGDSLMAPADSNPKGHFEDLEFYRLHQRMLAANGLCTDGFTCQETIEPPPSARVEAAELVRRRRAANRPWGWKDPRTILFLDFWASLVPEAKWLFVARSPEEVVDSLFRRGDTAFTVNPRHALDVWVAYARRIVDFVSRHPERAAIVDVARVAANPAGIVTMASQLMGTELGMPEPTYEPGLLTTGQSDHRTAFILAARPEAHDLYAELLRLGGSDTAFLTARGPIRMTDVAEAGIAEWAVSCRGRAERANLGAREVKARHSLERVSSDLEAERIARSEAASRADHLEATVSALANDLARERVARVELDHQSSGLDAERGRLQAELADLVQRQAESEREWSHRMDTARAERSEIVADLQEALDAARALTAAAHAGRDEVIVTLESQHDAMRHELEVHKAAFREELGNQRAAFRTELDAQKAFFREEISAQRDAFRTEIEAQKNDLHIDYENQKSTIIIECEAQKGDLRIELEAERDELVAMLEMERDGLVAQLEAERMIHESLRMDMTGRIEAAVAGTGRDILG